MTQEPDWKDLEKNLSSLFKKSGDIPPDKESLGSIIKDQAPANIALAMEGLKPEQTFWVFQVLDKSVASEVLAKLVPERTKEIVTKLPPEELHELIEPLPPREAASVLTEARSKQLRTYLNNEQADPSTIHDAQQRREYPKGSAGRLMTTQYIHLHADITVADAIEVVRHTDPQVDIPEDLYVIERDKTNHAKYRLLGIISIRDLLMSDSSQHIADVMSTDVISIEASADEKDAAALLSKYKFMSLPVVDKEGYLEGVIPSDDLMPVIVGRLGHLYNQAVGADAERMEKLSPFQEAKLRVPWLLGTMLIELGSGLVISHFDAVLKKIILLASFMPVISAISGNVGLQAAAITVRALDTGTRKSAWTSLKKEGATALLMAMACGLVLGAIGGIWAKHLPFGIVIGIALTCSMLTAGFMGTVIPMVSKRLGFDPATTAGPFETAFQDVVGFAVFLWLATVLQHWIT